MEEIEYQVQSQQCCWSGIWAYTCKFENVIPKSKIHSHYTLKASKSIYIQFFFMKEGNCLTKGRKFDWFWKGNIIKFLQYIKPWKIPDWSNLHNDRKKDRYNKKSRYILSFLFIYKANAVCTNFTQLCTIFPPSFDDKDTTLSINLLWY
jgi:hypothetical protein